MRQTNVRITLKSIDLLLSPLNLAMVCNTSGLQQFYTFECIFHPLMVVHVLDPYSMSLHIELTIDFCFSFGDRET